MEQFDRVERYLQRMRKIYAGLPHAHEHADYYEDDVISFFIHCHHLRDWILQLNRVGETSKGIDGFINAHHELKVCADLCNGSKHCHIERVRSGRQPHIAGKSWSVTTFTPEAGVRSTFKAKYHILANNKTYDALELAERCFELWSSYRSSLALKVNHIA
jgi:hypothetical protein